MMVVLNSKAIVNLREVPGILDDPRLEVMLLTSIACVTREKLDIRRAVSEAKSHGMHNDYVGKSLAVIVRTLARAGKFDEAREIATHMKGASTFWHTTALISIVEFSGEKQDEENAWKSIPAIRASHLHYCAGEDLKLALENHRSGRKMSFDADLTELNSVFSKLEALEDSHVLAPRVSSARLRMMAQEIVDRIFANVMK